MMTTAEICKAMKANSSRALSQQKKAQKATAITAGQTPECAVEHNRRQPRDMSYTVVDNGKGRIRIAVFN